LPTGGAGVSPDDPPQAVKHNDISKLLIPCKRAVPFFILFSRSLTSGRKAARFWDGAADQC